ncbi:MAG: hypothetical protein ISS77_08480 [Phycisphaerae bacterium]|nr:hypothetical protein [Phycisphaerae bacterium]
MAAQQLQSILNRLQGVKQAGSGHSALCPAHEDNRNSLSIGIGDDGRVLLKCHAGCSIDDICNTLKIKKSDLFATKKASSKKHKQRGRIIKAYDYIKNGQLIHQTVRKEPKDFFQRRPDGKDGWIWNLKGVETILYRHDEIIKADPDETIFIPEGEKDVDRLVALGLLATTCPMGAEKWKSSYSDTLKSRKVVILPDKDPSGERHMQQVALSLRNKVAEIKSIRLPGLPKGGDVSDWLNNGGSKEQLIELVDQTKSLTKAEIQQFENREEKKEKKDASDDITQGEKITRICESEGLEFFQDQYAQPHMTMHFDGDYSYDAPVPTSSTRFKSRAAQLYREKYGSPPGSEAIRQAQVQIEAKCYDRPQKTLYNRVALAEDDSILYDQSNDSRQCVRITPEGWNIEQQPTIFRRFKHQEAQVTPIKGGDPHLIFNFCNIASSDRCLFLITLTSWFIPEIAHPILLLVGPPGTGKSSTTSKIKDFVDPSAVPYMAAPKDEQCAEHHFAHHWLISYDNISRIPTWWSDVLCRAVTGGGSSQRQLYTDGEDVVRNYRRCIIVNAVGNPVYRPDLLDRSVLIETTSIENPKTETEHKRLWGEQKPFILGGILDAISKAMSSTATWSDKLPRMADFAVWGVRLSEALGFDGSEFIDSYGAAIEDKWTDMIELNPFAKFIVDLVRDKSGYWEGSSSDLISEYPDEFVKQKLIPKTPVPVGRELMQLTPALLKTGIICEKTKSGGKRLWILRYTEDLNVDDDIPF